MLNVTRESKGSVLSVRLSGSIEENVNFELLIGPPPPELEVHCKDVPRINSLGVKAWIKYFQECRTKNTQLKFVECSIAIVEQINLISNFSSGGIVESVYVPFVCTKCGNELLGLYQTEEIKRLQFDLPQSKCTQCGSPAEFDDVPDEYFRFLMK